MKVKVKAKVSGAKKGRKCVLPQSETSSGHNSAYIKYTAMRFASCMKIFDMIDRMV